MPKVTIFVIFVILISIFTTLNIFIPKVTIQSNAQSLNDPSIVQDISTGNQTVSHSSLTCVFGGNVLVGDTLVVIASNFGDVLVSTITDTRSNTFTKVVDSTSAGNEYNSMYDAQGTPAGADTITLTWQSSAAGLMACYELSKSTLDKTSTATGTTTPNNFAVGSFTPATNALLLGSYATLSASPPDSFTSGATFARTFDLYESGQGNQQYDQNNSNWAGGATTCPITGTQSSASGGWAGLCASFVPAVAQPVKFTVSPGGSATQTLTVAGCGANVSSISGDGTTKTIQAAPSCSLSFTLPAATASNRNEFNSSAVSVSLTTCAAPGPCSLTRYTYYFQDNFSLKYSVSDSTGPSAPSVSTGTQYGATYNPTLTTSYATYWLDNNSAWAVTNPLGGASTTIRYVTPSAGASGTTKIASTLTFTYYHQFLLNDSSCSGCSFTRTNNGTSSSISASGFVDAGTSWTLIGKYTEGYSMNNPWDVNQCTNGLQLLTNVTAYSVSCSATGKNLNFTATNVLINNFVPAPLALTPSGITDNGIGISFTYLNNVLVSSGPGSAVPFIISYTIGGSSNGGSGGTPSSSGSGGSGGLVIVNVTTTALVQQIAAAITPHVALVLIGIIAIGLTLLPAAIRRNKPKDDSYSPANNPRDW